MIDMSSNNTFQQLKRYTIDYHSDGVTSLLTNGEMIRFSFNNDTDPVKVFITDKRIIIEQTNEKSQYTFIDLQTLNYLQMEVDELSRQASEVQLIFGLRNGQELTLIIEDEVNPITMHAMMASKIYT